MISVKRRMVQSNSVYMTERWARFSFKQLWIVFMLSFPIALSKKVVFKASRTLQKLVKADSQTFRSWYEEEGSPLRLLKLNPGIEEIEISRDVTTRWRGYLAPQSFPGGVKLRSVVDFDVSFDKKTLSVNCTDGALKYEFEGPFPPLVRMLSALMPSVETTNILTLEEQKGYPLLVNSASLLVKFSLPNFFPIPMSAVESGGSMAMQKTIDSDLSKFLENVINEYNRDLSQQRKT